MTADMLAICIARRIAVIKHANAHGFASYNTKDRPCPVCGATGLCHCPMDAIRMADDPSPLQQENADEH